MRLLDGCSSSDVNSKHGGGGSTPLMNACTHGAPVRLLDKMKEKGVDIHATYYDRKSALHIASYTGHLECVKWLVQQGADMTAKAFDGTAPLDVARSHNKTSVVQFLEAEQQMRMQQQMQQQGLSMEQCQAQAEQQALAEQKERQAAMMAAEQQAREKEMKAMMAAQQQAEALA